jgi:hypothetical protein
MAQRDRLHPDIGQLYRDGIPTLQFRRIGSKVPSTRHTSNHLPVDTVHIREFEILDEFAPDVEFENFHLGSSFLNLDGVQQFRRVSFASEASIQNDISALLSDVVKLLGSKFQVLCECSIINEASSSRRSHKADFWTVYHNGRPIFLLEVKSPEVDVDEEDEDDGEILSDRKVLGQAYDYLKNLQEFHGALDVFGAVTTLNHWKLVWLPDSDELATSTILPPMDNPPAPAAGQLDADEGPGSRGVSCSPTYRHDKQELVRILMSAIRKAESTSVRAVPILAHERLYVTLDAAGWHWTRLKRTESARFNNTVKLALTQPPVEGSAFLVLKYLHCGPERKIWLTMITSAVGSGSLCVVKQVGDMPAAAAEARLWGEVNQGCIATEVRVSGQPAIVVPFVVLADVTEGRVTFCFDPQRWLLQDNVAAGAVPERMLTVATRLRELATAAGLLNAEVAARSAIARMAARGLRHKDLKWQHVALIPRFDDGGALVGVSAGVVDLESVEEGVEPAAASAAMLTKLGRMVRGKTFEV